MHLSKLFLRNFKKYRRAEIEFQDGLTGIVGSNGSGKSTIVEAIAWALYGNRASTIKRDLIKNSRASDSDLVEVKLNLGMGTQDLTIYRAMKGKGLMPDAALFIGPNRVASGSREVDMRLEEILDISYQDFMKTFYARQKDLDNLLKEGGAGKREYLLKLLSLDDIKERAIEEIKQDRADLEGRSMVLTGALSEIGDVEDKIQETVNQISSAMSDLSLAEKSAADLASILEMRKLQLEVQAEKAKSYSLLSERASALERSISEKKKAASEEETRLKAIELSKKALSDLDPGLKRLKEVKARLEALEPVRKRHDEISRKIARSSAELDGARNLLKEKEGRLFSLLKDRETLEEMRPQELEYCEVKSRLDNLEKKRDEHLELQTHLKGERIRLGSLEAAAARTEAALKGLEAAGARLDQILPLKDEHRRLQEEMSEILRQRDLHKEIEGLRSRRSALEARSQKLTMQASAVHQEMKKLGDIEALEAQLWSQDRELDRLGSSLGEKLAELSSLLKLQDAALSDALQSLARVKGLGPESQCPTCERPLGDQYTLLLQKYKDEASRAEKARSDLKEEIGAEKEMLKGVTTSRSNLKKAFDDLNEKKSRRAGLVAGLKATDSQRSEVLQELEEISKSEKALGKVSYDPWRFAEVEAKLEKLLPLVEEANSLAVRLEELPKRKAELEEIKREKLSITGSIEGLEKEIEALGFDEKEHSESRSKLAKLLSLHERFASLEERTKEISALEDAASLQKLEFKRLEEALEKLQADLKGLSFDPTEHEAMIKEGRSLSSLDEEAQRIRLKIASEPETVSRLKEARSALAVLESEKASARDEIARLGYSEEAHSNARQALSEAEGLLDMARKEVSEKKVQLGLLEGELSRLKSEAARAKEMEEELSSLSRKLQVADVARTLINRFLDQVLLKVKDDIAKSAGDILEEVSGKYSLLKIDDEFNIKVEDGGEYYPISRYSGGEVDMIAVSVRVAISEYLMNFGSRGPGYSFLILDEIFGSQDMEHREAMIGMLRKLEERFPQVIVISHISDVQGQFDNTINVVEDEMGYSRIEAS